MSCFLTPRVCIVYTTVHEVHLYTDTSSDMELFKQTRNIILILVCKFRNTVFWFYKRMTNSIHFTTCVDPVFDSEQFMDNFKERFLRVVAAKDIAEKLKTKGVIPESVHCHFVNPQTTDSDANLKLFRHLHQHGAPSIIRSLCDIMIQERGYPNMNTLGREMSAHTSLPPS